MNISTPNIIVNRTTISEPNLPPVAGRKSSPKVSPPMPQGEQLPPPEAPAKDRSREIKTFGFLLIIAAALFSLAMISYTSLDEANAELSMSDVAAVLRGDEMIKARADTTRNWLGLFGAVISNFLYNYTIGFQALLLPILMVVWGRELLSYKAITSGTIRRSGLFLGLAILISAIFGTILIKIPEFPREWSGAVGQFLASVLTQLTGALGSFAILITSIALVLVFGFNLRIESLQLKVENAWMKVMSLPLVRRFNRKEAEDVTPDQAPIEANQEPLPMPVSDAPEQHKIVTADDDFEPAIMLRSVISKTAAPAKQEQNSWFDGAIALPNEQPSVSRKAMPEPASDFVGTNDTPVSVATPSMSGSGAVSAQPQRSSIEAEPIVQRRMSASEVPQIQNSRLSQEPVFVRSAETVLPGAKSPESKQEEKPVIQERRGQDANPQEPVRTDSSGVSPELGPLRKIVTPPTTVETRSPAPPSASRPMQPAGVQAHSSAQPVQEEAPKVLTLNVHEIVQPKEEIAETALVDTFDEEINYVPPSIDLLFQPTETSNYVQDEELRENARLLQEKLETFRISIENLTITTGPVITQYEFVPAAGIKLSQIESLSDDIALALKARGIRIIAPIPGRGTVGIEIPNHNPSTVYFSSIIKSPRFHDNEYRLPLALGKTISGEVYCTDLAKMPHLLIAGSTGSGKSVGINTVIASLLYKMHPKDLKFVIIDPKKVEMTFYAMLKKHFLAISPDVDESIVTTPENAVLILKALELEMERRYGILASVGQRNIADYNQKVKQGKYIIKTDYQHRSLPYIVVVIDELADLMMTASREVEGPIARLAQLARAVGIHLVVATQRPSVDVITGVIKSNFPARLSYQVASKIDSRTILDAMGADQLLGNGDMLFLPGGTPKPIRLQNSFLSTDEVEAICNFIGDQEGYTVPFMLPKLSAKDKAGKNGNVEDYDDDDRDELLRDAAEIVIRHQQGSVSLLQRKLKIGYSRAARIMDELEAAGVVGPFDGSKARAVMLESEAELEAYL